MDSRKEKATARKKPGSSGEGNYYHIIVRPKDQFKTFRTHDVGRKGHTLRVAGKIKSGSWATQKWLINKEEAYVKNSYLYGKNNKVKKLLKNLGATPRRVKADIFKSKPRKTSSEK